MKKIILSLSTVLILASCGSTKEASSEASADKKNSSLTNMAATQLLSSLTKNASMDDITKLFGLLDKNKDDSVSKDEAQGEVATNFDALDKDKNNGLNLKEMQGLLAFLK
jgi:Ca2+-binding EF-hand superfamily protein